MGKQMKRAKGLTGPVIVCEGQLKLKKEENEMDFSKVGIKGASPVIGKELATYQSQLPATIEDLHTYVLVGEQQIKAHQAKIRACKKLPDAQKYEAAALQEAQGFAETVIIAQAKLGELLAAMPKKPTRTESSPKGTFGGRAPSLPEGITKSESHKAQTIAENPDVVQAVIAKAKDENRIPTPNEVYKEVSYNREKRRAEEAKAKSKEIKAVIAIDQVLYISALDRCLLSLPTKPPSKWDEDAFKEAKSKAGILIKRLEVFDGNKTV